MCIKYINSQIIIQEIVFYKEDDLYMKATGIVRRIDDLGRVVIPKEIRKTLRIREGDPLEIFTDREGGVILKKYSPISELTDFSREYAESLQQTIGNVVLVVDRDEFISVSGCTKKEYMERKISAELEDIIDGRKTVEFQDENGIIPLHKDDDDFNEKYASQVISPIIAGGDSIGALIILSKEKGTTFGELEMKLAETATAFLGKQMGN